MLKFVTELHLPNSVKDRVISPFCEGFIFAKLHIRSFAKIKTSRKAKISEFTVSSAILVLFMIILYLPVNNFSVISNRFPVFLG